MARLVLVAGLVVIGALFLLPSEVDARHGRGGCVVYCPCPPPCPWPEPWPWFSYEGTAYNPFAGIYPGPQPYDVRVFLTYRPHPIPGYAWCYIPYFGCWHWAYVFEAHPIYHDQNSPKTPEKDGKTEKATAVPVEAQIIVTAAPHTLLSFDGQPVAVSAAAVRVFDTPKLEPGYEYSYQVRATMTRNGQSETIVRQVVVRPGQEARLDLTQPETRVAAR